jgi:Flp pilus assembly CpaF family ATPase
MITPYEILKDTLESLKSLLFNDEIQEIMINSPDNIWIEERGVQKKTDISISVDMLLASMELLARVSNQELSLKSPLLEARLEDGSRVAGAIPPITESPCLSIRKFSIFNPSLTDYSLTDEIINFLKEIIKSKDNFLISGGTSSGKTTFFNALLKELDETDRIIVIEDIKELKINSPNIVRLETKADPQINISMRDLVKLSLRLRPDKIILGEVRDASAYDLLAALNTGHSGGSTIHANSAYESLSRLETLVLQAQVGWPYEAIKKFIADTINYVIYLERDKNGHRSIKEIKKITGYNGDYIMEDL